MTLRGWKDADWAAFEPIFREVVQDGRTYAIDPTIDDAAARAFWSDAAHRVVVHDGEHLLGAAKMGPNRPAQGGHVGTASFMVGSAARGRGVGRALGEYVVEWHRAQGYRGIQFNAVVATNTSAVRLWESLGFEIIGTVPDAFRLPDASYAGLHVMHLDLTGAQPSHHHPAGTAADPTPLVREQVLDVAARLFAERGWHRTTTADVAADAGVSVIELGRAFGSKADLLMLAFRRASLGGHDTLQSAFSALDLEGSPDVDTRLSRVAEFAADVLEPMRPLVQPLRDAAGEDPTALALRQGAELRRVGTSRALTRLLCRGEAPDPDAVAVVHTLTSGETYLSLTSLGWTREHYVAWLRDALDVAVNGAAAGASRS